MRSIYLEIMQLMMNKVTFSQWYTGGCHGNGNRFETKEFCEAACRRSGPGVASKKRPGPQGSLVNICNLPSDIGTGSEKNNGWFYDSEKSECKAFLYSGAGGNANRYSIKKYSFSGLKTEK